MLQNVYVYVPSTQSSQIFFFFFFFLKSILLPIRRCSLVRYFFLYISLCYSPSVGAVLSNIFTKVYVTAHPSAKSGIRTITLPLYNRGEDHERPAVDVIVVREGSLSDRISTLSMLGKISADDEIVVLFSPENRL